MPRRIIPPIRAFAAPWQFKVFRNDKAGLSEEQGKSLTWRPDAWPAPGEDRSTGRFWLGGVDGANPAINPNALGNLPDAGRDVIVSINFRAYHPRGGDPNRVTDFRGTDSNVKPAGQKCRAADLVRRPGAFF